MPSRGYSALNYLPIDKARQEIPQAIGSAAAGIAKSVGNVYGAVQTSKKNEASERNKGELYMTYANFVDSMNPEIMEASGIKTGTGKTDGLPRPEPTESFEEYSGRL